ncbi:AAA family ATPase [Rhodopirellula islandica]|nr:AAA family ATPase [Rhodopirellula islandica]
MHKKTKPRRGDRDDCAPSPAGLGMIVGVETQVESAKGISPNPARLIPPAFPGCGTVLDDQGSYLVDSISRPGGVPVAWLLTSHCCDKISRQYRSASQAVKLNRNVGFSTHDQRIVRNSLSALIIDRISRTSMPHLQSVRIQRFKRIEDAVFDLQPLNVLVGANNSGKSSVIQALHFTVGVIQTLRLTESRRSASTLNPSQLIYSPTESVYPLGAGGRLLEDRDQAISVKLELDTGEYCTVSIRKGRNRNINVTVDHPSVAESISDLSKPFTIFSPGLAGISKNEQYVSDGVLLRTLARGDANLVLRNILLRLWGKPEWHTFIHDLREVFPDCDIQVKWEDNTDEFIDVSYVNEGKSVPIELAGTGALQAMQILSYIHRFGPSLIVLDEPDSHLHPNNQRLLCGLLRTIAEERDTQVVLTTHSRHVVDALSGAVRFLWVRNGTVEVASEDDEVGVLLDIGALDVRERVNSIDARAIVLTEDTNHRLLEILLKANCFDTDHTLVLPYHGVTAIRNLRPLLQVIRSSNAEATIVVHRDRDFLDEDEARGWEESVRRIRVEPMLTHGTDVESHFLNPDYLAANNPDLSSDEFDELLCNLRRDNRSELIQTYVNGKLDIARSNGTFGRTNIGQLAAEAAESIDRNPKKLAHGKTLLRRLRESFRITHGKNLVLADGDQNLLHDEFQVIARKAFPVRT